MKNTGRALIILAVFTLLAGLMLIVVNTTGLNKPDFNGGRSPRLEFRPDGKEQGFSITLSIGARWALSIVKNMLVIGALVAPIVFSKNMIRKKRKTIIVNSARDE